LVQKEGSNFKANARAGKQVTGMTRHLIEVIVRVRPPARKM
jgi:hypothetical protein